MVEIKQSLAFWLDATTSTTMAATLHEVLQTGFLVHDTWERVHGFLTPGGLGRPISHMDLVATACPTS
jgi:hypothetical protein